MISRLFQIVYKLMECPQMTAKDLAMEVGVSERTIYRDVEKLSLAGIPIYANQGKNGGIALLPNYVLNKTVLSEEEKKSILESLAAFSSVNIEESEQFEKLKTFFGTGKNYYDWIEVEFSSWSNRDADESLFNKLKSAILNFRILEIEYAGYKTDFSKRKIKPLKMCFKNECWYLYAFCLLKNDYRFFKLSRIKAITETDDFFETETVGKVLPKMSQQYESTLILENKVIVEIDSKMAYRAYDELEVLEQLEDGKLKCSVNIPDSTWLINYLLSYGSALKVLEPESVKNQMKDEIKRMMGE